MDSRRLLILTAVVLSFVLLAEGARSGEVDHDNVMIVLDASGSMQNAMSGTSVRKMDAAKQALQKVLTKVPGTTHIGVLVFSSSNLRKDLVYPLGPRDDAKLSKAVDSPEPGGSTPLGAYIKKGADLLLKQRAQQMGYGTYRLLIVTDGEAQDKTLVEKYTPEAISRGITVDVIGVGMLQTHTLATQVHSYRSADDPEALRKALADVFAEVSATGSDAAGADAFEMVAALPDGIAEAALTALSISGNHPLGTFPPGARAVAASKRTSATDLGEDEGMSSTTVVLIGVAVAVVLVPVLLSRKKRRKSH